VHLRFDRLLAAEIEILQLSMTGSFPPTAGEQDDNV